MTRFALLLTLLAACSKDNPYYCEGDGCAVMPDADISAPACEMNEDCTDASAPVCGPSGTCVACTAGDIGACAGATPVCVTAMNMCAPCEAHDQCASNACMPSGACGLPTEVAYVATSGNNSNACTLDAPCATLTYAATLKPYVKLQNDIDEAVSFPNVTVTVLADPGTIITRSGTTGPVITASGSTNVTLHDVVIRDGAGPTGHGISVAASDNGVSVTLDRVAILSNNALGLSIGGGLLKMSRCVVANNTGGGASINAQFDITNSMFVVNGAPASQMGGLLITPPGTGTKVFSFNTVAGNQSLNAGAAMKCVFALTATNTLLANNEPDGCTFEHSMFDVTIPAGGTMNKLGNAQFRSTNAGTPLAADFYRIGSTSDAIDSATMTSTLMTDIDGDGRPQNNIRDIGADEYK